MSFFVFSTSVKNTDTSTTSIAWLARPNYFFTSFKITGTSTLLALRRYRSSVLTSAKSTATSTLMAIFVRSDSENLDMRDWLSWTIYWPVKTCNSGLRKDLPGRISTKPPDDSGIVESFF